MSSPHPKRTPRRLTRRARGQALPLIGLMIVVVVAMVGLSVDVGNTFSEERQAVAAANAASLAGMNTYIDRTGSTTNKTVYESIINTLNSNGVQVAAPGVAPVNGQLELNARYLDAQGKLIENAAPEITNNTNQVPANVAFIQVNLSGRVGTYFARVVGRGDLPIAATSHAGTCPLGEGIYPIAVNSNYIESGKFRSQDIDPADGTPDNRWRVLGSGPYRGKTAMRIDVQAGDTPGGFTWLRWGADKGATGANAGSDKELRASLDLPGNVTSVFDEAPWPDPATKPDDYPTRPGQLNGGDWVYGSNGYSQSTDSIMDMHREEGTRMILPIYDQVLGQGKNTQYRVVNLGVFVLLDHGNDKGEKYIELIYVGEAERQSTACNYDAAPDPAQTYSLFGEVQFRPEYAYNPTERKPIQYVVVLDVSGSMSANFAGQCDRGSGNAPSRGYWQCTNGPDGAPTVEVTGTGPTYYWSKQDERRVYVAKTALEQLVRSTNMVGNGSQYTDSRPVDQMALVWFTSTVSKNNGNFKNFSSDPGVIIDDIRAAGKQGNDSYRTSGGTNGAAGLYRAALALDAAPPTVTDRTGKTWTYKRVVVFITDGVSNNFLNKSDNNLFGGSSDMRTYPDGHVCKVANVVEIATCQVTGNGTSGGGKYNGMDRPITQAGNVSKEDLQPKGVEVYAIALSNIPDTGLKDSVASFPKYFFAADTLERDASGKTNVDKIMEVINTQVEAGLCVPRSDALDGKPEWRGTIPADQYQAFPGSPAYPTVGEVLLENVETGNGYRIPIVADSAGNLTYRKDEVPKGNYKLTPYIFYRHPLDPPTAGPRRYSLIDTGSGASASDITVYVGPGASDTGSFNQQVRQDLKLRVMGDVCAKP